MSVEIEANAVKLLETGLEIISNYLSCCEAKQTNQYLNSYYFANSKYI